MYKLQRSIIDCISILSLIAIMGSLCSCTATRLATDQRYLRSEMMSLYEAQIDDNIVRAKQGRPLLHIRYRELVGSAMTTARIDWKDGENGSEQQVTTGATQLVDLDVDEDFINLFGEIRSDLAMTGDPIYNNPELYRAYVKYAETFVSSVLRENKAAADGLLQESWREIRTSETALAPSPKHRFFISNTLEARQSFQELVMLTLAEAPQDLKDPNAVVESVHRIQNNGQTTRIVLTLSGIRDKKQNTPKQTGSTDTVETYVYEDSIDQNGKLKQKRIEQTKSSMSEAISYKGKSLTLRVPIRGNLGHRDIEGLVIDEQSVGGALHLTAVFPTVISDGRDLTDDSIAGSAGTELIGRFASIGSQK